MRLVEAYGLPAALRAIFVKKTVLDHFELKLTYCAYDFSSVELIGEHLSFTPSSISWFYTFVELLGFHRVGILDIFEHLR